MITRGALRELDLPSVMDAVSRHESHDWGELEDEDKTANDRALLEGTRLLSAYRDRHGTKFWVITEADRASTTVLLPSEY